MTFEQWQGLAQNLRNHADKIAASYRERAKELCREAGLDENLLGIHPHNAMVSYASGNPWPNVDYSKVKLCLWLLENQWLASRVVDDIIKETYPKPERKAAQ